MNRKGTREQNDISIIIGNLPKRIQDKIIIRGESSSSSSAARKGGNRIYDTEAVDNGYRQEQRAEGATDSEPVDSEVTAIDYFLRLPADGERKDIVIAKPALETVASGSTANTAQIKVLQKHPVENVDTQEIVSIPGLIRLNAENVKKLNETSSTASSSTINGLRNHERRNRHQTRQEVLASSKSIMPMSPVRQIQKVNHQPSWFGLLDDTLGRRLPPLFESYKQIINLNQVVEVISDNSIIFLFLRQYRYNSVFDFCLQR